MIQRILLMVAVSAVLSTQVHAAAINLTSPSAEYLGGSYTLGFQFSVVNSTNLTSLGVYDSNKDGLAAQVQVGLWDTSGALLTSAFIPSGAGGVLDGYFRYVDIADFNLLSGVDYIIGAYMTDTFSFLGHGYGGTGTGTVDSNVIVKFDRFSDYTNFSFPTYTEGRVGVAWLGANFRTTPIEIAKVPEPATIALLGLGLFGFAASRRKSANKNT